ncbi:DMT family transporter [Maribacter sp. 2307ULW6-5]|uniref:DMT family transporter n=1 Tax=Maribacter sp. 2307ULW6-5 TaxID=3386275 RepID=UPI0039BD49F3
MRLKNPHLAHILEINIAMVFIGTSGALGRYVELPVPIIIGSRAILAVVILYVFCRWMGISLAVKREHYPVMFMSGVLMGGHWVTYFYALQWSSVAIGMLSMFTYPVVTAFLEPILLKTTFQKIHLLLGALVLAGIYFLSPDFDLQDSNTLAIGIGVLSAFCYSLRNLLMKTKVAAYHGSAIMVYQTAIVAILLFPALFYVDFDRVLGQWKGILALAVLTTAIGHSLFLMTFKHFSITTVSIISSVQPVYGILIGFLFLNEIPEWSTVFGGTLILGAVVIESVRTQK